MKFTFYRADHNGSEEINCREYEIFERVVEFIKGDSFGERRNPIVVQVDYQQDGDYYATVTYFDDDNIIIVTKNRTVISAKWDDDSKILITKCKIVTN